MKTKIQIDGLLGIAITFLIIYGYIANIIKLVNCDFEPSYKSEIIRTVGLITGTGVIMGFMDIEDMKSMVVKND